MGLVIASHKNFPKVILNQLQQRFNYKKSNLPNKLQELHSSLKNNLYFAVEFPYVDKVHRDAYYNYYSSKVAEYYRNTIRVSVFRSRIKRNDFYSEKEYVNRLTDSYLGYFVLRPTFPQILGRNQINPTAFNINPVSICSASISTTANSLKFAAVGFPHASQDTEIATCAETSIWSVVEYFGNKFPEYIPILPSKIIKILNSVTSERQLPSKGLDVNKISYVLKNAGFGPLIYDGAPSISLSEAAKIHKRWDFHNIFSCYIESGIPVVCALSNEFKLNLAPAISDRIGHANVCVGIDFKSNLSFGALKQTPLSIINDRIPKFIDFIQDNKITIYDINDVRKRFVFQDDNCVPYQCAHFDTPCDHYKFVAWERCEIVQFIIPLQNRIYVEAKEAKKSALNFILLTLKSLSEVGKLSKSIQEFKLIYKTFLTTSRSYKQYISLNPTLSLEVKSKILETTMAKFIWVTELLDVENIDTGMITGLTIVDATESRIELEERVLFAILDNKMLFYNKTHRNFQIKDVILRPFSGFNAQLTNFK